MLYEKNFYTKKNNYNNYTLYIRFAKNPKKNNSTQLKIENCFVLLRVLVRNHVLHNYYYNYYLYHYFNFFFFYIYIDKSSVQECVRNYNFFFFIVTFVERLNIHSTI